MFNKLVAIEPVSLIPSAEEALHQYAKEVVLYRDIAALWSTSCMSSPASCTVLGCPCCGTSRWRSPG